MQDRDVTSDLQKYYPLFHEGYGTEYERFALNRFVSRMVDRYGIHSILEMPANGVMGVPGIKSMIFAAAGCEVTVSHPSQEFLDNAKQVWDAFGLEATFARSPWIGSAFGSGSFDLVWNFCVFEHFADPGEVIAEMLRVTKGCIFLQIQNIHNIGLPIHRAFHAIRNEPWDHGEPASMDLSRLSGVIRENHGSILETGATDMPPWPDINIGLRDMLSGRKPAPDMPAGPGAGLRPSVRTRDRAVLIGEIRNFKQPAPKDELVYQMFRAWYSVMETGMPFPLKRYLAHHPYIIAGKK
jgi:SAM-dependent methyltransferase